MSGSQASGLRYATALDNGLGLGTWGAIRHWGDEMKDLDASYISWGGGRIHRAWVMLLGCCFIQSTTGAMLFGCFGNFIVPICDDLGSTRAEIGLFQTAYFLSMIPSFPMAAWFMDRFSLKKVMSFSLIGLVFSTILMAFYSEGWQWAISGALAGFFSCMVFHVPPVTMVANWFSKRVGVAMGFSTAISSLVVVFLSPFLAGLIAEIGWRAAFLVEAGIMLVFSLPWCLFVFVNSPEEIGARPYGADLPDAAEKQSESVSDGGGKIEFRKEMLTVPFVMLFIFSGIAAIIGKGYDPHIPGYVQSLGFDAAFGALMISALNLGSFVEKIIMGWINDKFGVWRGIVIEVVVVVAGIVGLLVFRSPVLLLVAAFFFGVQDSFTNVALPLAVREIFGQGRRYTLVYSWTKVGGGVFGAFSTVLVGATYDLTASYTPAFILGIAFVLVGGFAVLVAYLRRADVTKAGERR